MGFEKRGNKTYYYHKKRIGKKVVSEYRGRDTLLLRSLLAIEGLNKNQNTKDTKPNKPSDLGAIDKHIDQNELLIQSLFKVFMLTSGYHTNCRRWRKRRNEKYEPRSEK